MKKGEVYVISKEVGVLFERIGEVYNLKLDQREEYQPEQLISTVQKLTREKLAYVVLDRI